MKRIFRVFSNVLSARKPEPFSLPRTAEFSPEFDFCLQDKPINVFYWPSYSNPYQKLFYGRDGHNYQTQPGEIDVAIDAIATNKSEIVCFHLHWLNFLFKPSKSGLSTAEVIENFLAKCDTFCKLGGRLVWTIHNAREHETPDPQAELELRKKIAALASYVMLHENKDNADIMQELDLPEEKVLVFSHGNYVGTYPNEVSKIEARNQLGISGEVTVFLNLGYMRPYKGLDMLIESAKILSDEGLPVSLLLAGSTSKQYAATLNALSRESPHVSTLCSWIPDDDIQIYMNAADFVVLPYQNFLTSGSAYLALSFARPLIAAERGALGELIDEGSSGFLYDPDERGGLTDAMRRAEATSVNQRLCLSQNAFKKATEPLWSEGRTKLVQKLLEGSP